jgi:hypothetical protein
LQLIGEAGVYFQHTGRGVGFNINGGNVAGTTGGPAINAVTIQNINLLGNYLSGSGTISYSQGAATVTGVGTHFTTECAVGDAISKGSGTSALESHRITVITDDTHLTVDANWIAGASGAAYTIGTTTDGFLAKNLYNYRLENLSVRDVNNAALDVVFGVSGSVRDFRCTIGEPSNVSYFHVAPQWAMIFDTLGGGLNTTTVYVYSADLDSFQAGGVWIKSTTSGCELNGVVAEVASGPAIGFLVEGNRNTLINPWCEAINAGIDLKTSERELLQPDHQRAEHARIELQRHAQPSHWRAYSSITIAGGSF